MNEVSVCFSKTLFRGTCEMTRCYAESIMLVSNLALLKDGKLLKTTGVALCFFVS